MSAWLAAFAGIDYPRAAGAGYERVGDLPDVLAPRLRNRMDTDSVRIPIRALYDIAMRINAQSERIVALEGAGPPLNTDDMAHYLRQQEEAAERAAVKSGVYVYDPTADWAALYNMQGACVTQGHLSEVNQTVLGESWNVAKFEADEFLFGWGLGPIPENDDYQEFPGTLAEFQAAYGARLRAEAASIATTAEALKEPRVPEDPITHEPGAERTERSA